MSFSSFKKDKLIYESFRKFVNEKADAGKVRSDMFPTKLSDVDPEKAKVLTRAGVPKQDRSSEDDQITVIPDKEYPVSKLKPSQSSMNIGKALAMAIAMIRKSQGEPGMDTGGNLGAFISNDGHIMDGHHRWVATAMVDPTASVGGYLVDFPADELIAILNAITKGRLGIQQGKKATGGFEQFKSGPIETQLRQYMTKGIPGKHPVPSEAVTKAMQQWTGAKDAKQALVAARDKFVENLTNVKFAVPSAAPTRPDMPVIDPDLKPGAIKTTVGALARGEVDVNPPYSDATKRATAKTGQGTRRAAGGRMRLEKKVK